MKSPLAHLSRREREIMDIVFAAREATIAEIEAQISNPPTRPALRSLVTILENKGHLTHTKRGREFVYQAAHKAESVGRSALGRVLHTFFEGSVTRALASFLGDPKARISQVELDELAQFVSQAKANQKPKKTPL